MLDDGEDIVAGDPTTLSGAGDLSRAELVFAQQAPDRRAHARIGVPGRRRRGGGGGGRRGRGRGGGAFGCWGRFGRRSRFGRRLVGAGWAGGGLLGFRSRLLRGCRFGRISAGLFVGLDDRDLGVVGDRGALLGEDLLEHAGEWRWNLGVDLVGDDLEERLVLLDGVAGLLQPLADRPLGHALAELGHRHLGHAGHPPVLFEPLVSRIAPARARSRTAQLE
jgi:hypothetical protein